MLSVARLAFSLMLASLSTAASACPICLPPAGGASVTLDQFDRAGSLVLAQPQSDPRRMTISAVLKGRASVGDTFTISYTDMPRTPFAAGKAVILTRHPLMNTWQPLGALPREREAWLRTITGLPPAQDLAPDAWPARVRIFADDLFADDVLVSQIAADQIARAPYAAMRTLAGSLSGDRLVAAAHRIEHAPRLPLLILLMGVAGDAPARDFVRQRLVRAAALAGADELAALITASIEMDGDQALAAAGARLSQETNMRAEEASGAVLALSVTGGASGADRRSAIAGYLRAALAVRPETAGSIARAMEDWRDWSLAGDLASASQSPRLDEGSRLLVRSYLEAASRARTTSTLN